MHRMKPDHPGREGRNGHYIFHIRSRVHILSSILNSFRMSWVDVRWTVGSWKNEWEFPQLLTLSLVLNKDLDVQAYSLYNLEWLLQLFSFQEKLQFHPNSDLVVNKQTLCNYLYPPQPNLFLIKGCGQFKYLHRKTSRIWDKTVGQTMCVDPVRWCAATPSPIWKGKMRTSGPATCSSN